MSKLSGMASPVPGPARRGMTRRRIVAGGAVSGSALALAACGGTRSDSGGSSSKLTGTVEFWQWGVTYVEGFEKIAAEFNEKAGGARVVHSQPADYDNKIKVTLAGGSGAPDVYLQRGPNHLNWAQSGLSIDITQYANRDKAAASDIKALLKPAVDAQYLQGKLYGLPWDLSTISVAYNLDMLERRGVRPPAELGNQWDWNTFIDYARRLTPGDGNTYGVNIQPGIETGWYNWAVANGASVWSADFKTCTINSPPMIEACEQYFNIAAKLRASPPRTWLTQQTTGQPHPGSAPLPMGLVAMQNSGDWFFPWYERAANLRWDVAPIPYSPRTKKTASIANIRGLVMSPAAQNRDLAWAWIAHLLKREVQDQIPALMGEVPSRTDSIEQVYLNPAKQPTPKSRRLLKASVDATAPLPGHPLIPWSGDGSISNTINGPMNDLYDGRREVREVLNELQQKLTALLQK